MADIKQGQQNDVHFIACEIPFSQDVCELVFGVDVPFIIILITASLSLNTYNKTSRLADWTFQGTESMSCITISDSVEL